MVVEATNEAGMAHVATLTLTTQIKELQQKVDTVEAETISTMANKTKNKVARAFERVDRADCVLQRQVTRLQRFVKALHTFSGVAPKAAPIIQATVRGCAQRRRNADVARAGSLLTAAVRGHFCRQTMKSPTLWQFRVSQYSALCHDFWITQHPSYLHGYDMRWRRLRREDPTAVVDQRRQEINRLNIRCKCDDCADDHLCYNQPLPSWWVRWSTELRDFFNPNFTMWCAVCRIRLQ
jgi:hypothetical protein